MNINRIMPNISPKMTNTKRIGQNIVETLPNQYKIWTFPNGKQSVFDLNGNLIFSQITKDGKTNYISK